MLRPMACLAAAALAIASLLPQPTQAGDPIKLVPADALGVLVVGGLDSLDAKLGKAGENLQLPLPRPLAGLKALPGLSECLDKDSPIVVMLLQGTEPDDDPVLVGLVPVTNFKAFAKVFGVEAEGDVVRLELPRQTVLAVEKDGCVVLVEEKEEATLSQVLKSPGGLTARLGDDLAWIRERDAALVMTDAGIAEFCKKVLEGISVAQQTMRAMGQDQFGTADVLSIYTKMFALVNQEVELAAVGVDVQESGDLVLRVRKRFLPEGRLAECLKLSDSPADMLAGLPGEPFVVAGSARFNAAMGNLMMELSVQMMASSPKLYGIGQEEADRMLKLAGPLMSEMQSIAVMLAVGQPDDSIYSRMVAVMKTADAEKYMEHYEQYIREFSAMMKGSKGMFSMAMDTKSIEIDGHQGVEISMDFPAEFMEQVPNADKMFEKMIGPGGKIRAFIVAADKENVVIGYTDPRLLRAAIATLESGASLSQGATVKTAAARLDDGNFGRGFLSPAGLIELINAAISSVAPAPQNEMQLPAFPETPPIAWSASVEGARADGQVLVPREVLKAGFAYAAKVRAAFQPPEE